MSREEMLKEFYVLIMRSNYENGLCTADRVRFEWLKQKLLES